MCTNKNPTPTKYIVWNHRIVEKKQSWKAVVQNVLPSKICSVVDGSTKQESSLMTSFLNNITRNSRLFWILLHKNHSEFAFFQDSEIQKKSSNKFPTDMTNRWISSHQIINLPKSLNPCDWVWIRWIGRYWI
jgi:hypothetical protein